MKNSNNLLLVLIVLLFTIHPSMADTQAYEDYNYAQLTHKCSVYDPYEKLNRKIFAFNGVLDAFILRPIAKAYNKITNDYTKNRVSSFLSNIREPLSTVNYAIQGRTEGAFKTFWRFAINSTFGIAGIFDVASKVGLKAEPQNLGNSFAHYGVGPGPYIVLPLVGGMGARDVMGLVMLDDVMNPIMYPMHKDFKKVTTATRIINSREKALPFTDYVTKNSLDPYITMRDAILNSRESEMIYPIGFVCPKVNSK
ncbi:MAG: VacJ family lipoprotein [Rickettsiaceae bacterium]